MGFIYYLQTSLTSDLSVRSLKEKVPKVHFLLQTFHHGYPSQPTCLEYDPIQQLLAVGAEDGAVLLYPATPESLASVV